MKSGREIGQTLQRLRRAVAALPRGDEMTGWQIELAAAYMALEWAMEIDRAGVADAKGWLKDLLSKAEGMCSSK